MTSPAVSEPIRPREYPASSILWMWMAVTGVVLERYWPAAGGQCGGGRVAPFGGHQGVVADLGAFQLADPAVEVVEAAEDVQGHSRPPRVGVTRGGVLGSRSMNTSRITSTIVPPS